MVFSFTAHEVGGFEEDGILTAGVAEEKDFNALLFMRSLDDEDEPYSVLTEDQAIAYGGVSELTLRDEVLRVAFSPDAQEALGMGDPELEVTLDAAPEDIDRFRTALRRILTHGDPKERPAVLEL